MKIIKCLILTTVLLFVTIFSYSQDVIKFNKVEVVELVYKYYFYFDSNRPSKQIEMWSDEVSFITPWSIINNKAELEKWNYDLSKSRHEEGGVRHFVVNPTVDILDNSANFTSYVFAIDQKTGVNSGTFLMKATVVSVGGRLKFNSMVFEADDNTKK